MANYENIRKYNEFNHKASLYGGPDNYLQLHAELYRQIGFIQGRDSERLKSILKAGVALVLWEGGKAVYREIKKRHKEKQEKMETLQKAPDDAKAILNSVGNETLKVQNYEEGQ